MEAQATEMEVIEQMEAVELKEEEQLEAVELKIVEQLEVVELTVEEQLEAVELNVEEKLEAVELNMVEQLEAVELKDEIELGEDVMDARLLELFTNPHSRPEAHQEKSESGHAEVRTLGFYVFINSK